MVFFIQQIIFLLTIALVLFSPGYFLFLAVWGKNKAFFSLEKLLISLGLSVAIIDFSMIIMGKAEIKFTRLSILLLILAISAAGYAIYRRRFRSEPIENNSHWPNFSTKQTFLIIALIFLTVFIKSIYLSGSIFPTSTDLGHHMFWANKISATGSLPVYVERDIMEQNGNYFLSEPEKISDFIIGEHLVFAAIGLISGANFVSVFPSTVLFVFNIAAILMVFVFTLRLFENTGYGKNVAILTLLFLGPLYAISNAEAKFVSGGVIGNLIGNFLIPFAFYFLFLALNNKNRVFFFVFLLGIFTLAYTHHLSIFIFAYAFIFSLVFFVLFNWKKSLDYFREWLKIILSPSILGFVIFTALFIIFVYTPDYLRASAISTAVGKVTKSTRAGLTFEQLKYAIGEPRLILGFFGVFILLFLKKTKDYSSALLFGWVISVFLMSFVPQFLGVNILSSRIANYLPYPAAITGAFALSWMIRQSVEKSAFFVRPCFTKAALFLIFISITMNGYRDNALFFPQTQHGEIEKQRISANQAIQTFHASEYLNQQFGGNKDLIVKDHNYIRADSWMKLYLLQDYNYPFSRGFFKRYEDETKKRELCTLWMISTPNSKEGIKCYNDLGVNTVVVKQSVDGAQFEKSTHFWEVYENDELGIYYRNN